MDNSYGLAELHEQLLIIMDDIDRVCRKHNIKYTLSDGTLLGAVRHKGFIPWDDDMDVRMVRDEFEKFKLVYEKEKNKDFIIGHPCNLATYSVINPTYDIPGMVQKEGTIINPWVSIFPMDNAPKNKLLSYLKATKMRLLSGMMGKPPQYANFSKQARRRWDITSFLGSVIGYKRVNKWFIKTCISNNKKSTGVYSSYTINSKGVHRRYPQCFFLEVKDFVFEDRVFKGLIMYDEYLTMAYGKDYMIPISEENRRPKHLNESY